MNLLFLTAFSFFPLSPLPLLLLFFFEEEEEEELRKNPPKKGRTYISPHFMLLSSLLIIANTKEEKISQLILSSNLSLTYLSTNPQIDPIPLPNPPKRTHHNWFVPYPLFSPSPQINSKTNSDVREPTELLTTGRIPTALSMPLNSNPNAIYLFPEAFRAKFGFDKPGLSSPSTSSPPSSLPSSPSPSSTSSSSSSSSPPPEAGASTEDKEDPNEEKVQEVIFYCLAGVRSKKAAELAASEDGWSGVRVGEWGGGWSEWEGRGGRVQRG